MSTFSQKLQAATNEDKQVNPIYVAELKKEMERIRGGGELSNQKLLSIDVENPIFLNTDGIFDCQYLGDHGGMVPFFLLMELKRDADLEDLDIRSTVLVQVIAYLTQIYAMLNNYETLKRKDIIIKDDVRIRLDKLPSTLLVGSKTHCFVIPTLSLKEYYTRNIDYDLIKSASTFVKTEVGKIIKEQVKNDKKIQLLVLKTSEKYCMRTIAELIYKHAKGIKEADDLSDANLIRAYEMFNTQVLTAETADRLPNRKKAELLAQFIINPRNIRVMQGLLSDVQSLIINGLEVEVNTDGWYAFQYLYNLKEYKGNEKMKITAITDRLIEDSDRRRKGDFYTPSIWVDEAHKLLDKNLGENWRDEYMVWDCAWGTGNLTREYMFSDLYCSTLHETDLEIGSIYNLKACKFQYDFLNDDVEVFENVKRILRSPFAFKTGINLSAMEKYINFKDVEELYITASDKGIITIEEGMKALQNAIRLIKSTKLYQNAPGLIDGLLGLNGKDKKKLLFLINPPYGTGSDIKSINNGNLGKAGIAETLISKLMEDGKVKGRRNLYTQIMYRIYKIASLFNSDIRIGLFSPSPILNSDMNKDIRDIFIKKGIGIINSFMLQASNFADVADNWAITFTLWSNTIEHNYKTSVCELQSNNIIHADEHQLKPIDKKDRAIENISSNKKYKKIPALVQTSAINVHEKTRDIEEGSLCQLMCNMNIVESNLQKVTLINGLTNANWKVVGVHEENFNNLVSYFTARKIIQPNWINSKDEYMVPNTSHSLYEQWESDCIVYSLFNTASNQSSLRNIVYNKQWNIYNEFFWLSQREMLKLIMDTDGADAIYEDIQLHSGKERYVYKKLQEVTLSPDAQAVLDKATELLKSSFKYRSEFNQKHPEYHINTWDAGWYQIKGLLKEYDKQGLEEFNKLYKQLEDRMRPLVYELGFLYK